ncbi:MAG: hypothetical protein CM15mP73_1010 [Hyphomicrobiales bacterium]|nr:MAG: hypothetical protein CM15mP73_1010 [Hyphomicrobiales bacterium]
MATGCLSQPLNAKIPGIEDFEGECYQSSLWPEKK